MNMVEKEVIRGIKRDFFALRNGEVADRLRKAGCPYKIIFGLLVPQLEQVASKVGHSAALADWLWDNETTRESRLLATMVHPVDEFTEEKASKWCATADTIELVDMLCFRLVRYLPTAENLVFKYSGDGDGKLRYFALRLAMNLTVLRKTVSYAALLEMAKTELAKNLPITRQLASQLIDEIEFIQDCD